MSHNTFGHLFRVTTFGESHGPGIGCVVDGCPPRIPLEAADIQAELDRRRPGTSRFTTQRREPDEARILSGVMIDDDTGRQVTTGTPIGVFIENVDQRSKDYGEIKDKYRPGHADYAYEAKYGIRDYRGGGRSSARETAARVAAGAIARKVIPRRAHSRRARADGQAQDRSRALGLGRGRPEPVLLARRRGPPARFADYLDDVRKAGSSVGAVIEIVAEGVPAGWGAPIYGKLDAELAGALMSINAVKGVEIGDGFAAAELSGEENADEMRRGNDGRPRFLSNHAGGDSRRHLDRTADRRPVRRQADIVDPDAAPHDHPRLRGDGDRHQGPPRSLRRHPRGAGRRSDGRLRAGGRLFETSRAGRRLALAAAFLAGRRLGRGSFAFAARSFVRPKRLEMRANEPDMLSQRIERAVIGRRNLEVDRALFELIDGRHHRSQTAGARGVVHGALDRAHLAVHTLNPGAHRPVIEQGR